MKALGFTGTSRQLTPGDQKRISEALEGLVERLSPQKVVTGACVGVDSFVHHWFAANHPTITRVVVIPGNLKAVDLSVEMNADHSVRMPPGSSNRERNQRLVDLSLEMAAFWTGQRRSGTYMTMNIAQKQGKMPSENIFGMGLSDAEVRRCYRTAGRRPSRYLT